MKIYYVVPDFYEDRPQSLHEWLGQHFFDYRP